MSKIARHHFALPTRANVVALLRQTALFEGETSDALLELTANACAQTLSPSETLWCVGAQLDALPLVLSGTLVVSRHGHALRKIETNQFVGLSPVLTDTRTTAEVSAGAGATLLVQFPSVDVNAYASKHPIILRRALQQSENLVEALTSERLEAESFDGDRDRDISVFQWLRQHAVQNSIQRATAVRIASDLKMHSRTVNKAKKALRQRGWISYADRRPTVVITKPDERASKLPLSLLRIPLEPADAPEPSDANAILRDSPPRQQ